MTISRFVYGGDRLDLTTSPYSIQNDYVPPAVAMNRQFTTSNFLAPFSGGDLVGERASDARQWQFTVLVKGTSYLSIEANIRRLSAFIQRYQEGGALYYEVSASNLPEPSWGTLGAPVRFMIASGEVRYNANYSDSALRESGLTVTVVLQLKPGQYGPRQRVMDMQGYVYTLRVGRADGSSGGLLAYTGSNFVRNPVFGAATWNTRWTAGASLIVTKNANPSYKLADARYSAMLTSKAGVNNTFYTQCLSLSTLSAHVLVAIIAKQDGTAATSADMGLYFEDGLSSAVTYESMGNGFTKVWAVTNTPLLATKNAGISVATNKTVYLAALGLSATPNYPVFPTWGDLPSCEWSGTAHDSYTYAFSASLSLTTDSYTVQPNAGSVAISFKSPTASAAFSTAYFIDALPFRASYSAGNLVFTDGTNTATGAASWVAGEVVHLLFTWGASGLIIYKNGVSVASAAGLAPPSSLGTIKLLTIALILGYQLYSKELTQADATSLYTACSTLTSAGNVVNEIPVLHSITSADSLIANECYGTFASGTARTNFGTLIGVPGVYPANVEMKAVGTEGASHLSLSASRYHVSPINFWSQQQGTVDVTCSGGQKRTVSVSTTPVLLASVTISDPRIVKDIILGREWFGLGSVGEAAGTGTVKFRVTVTISGQTYTGPYAQYSTDTTMRLVRANGVSVPNMNYVYENPFDAAYTAVITLYAARTSGGAANMYVDFGYFVPSLTYVEDAYTTGIVMILSGNTFLSGDATLTNLHQSNKVEGDFPRVLPGAYNNIVMSCARLRDAYAPGTGQTLSMYVSPCWSLT